MEASNQKIALIIGAGPAGLTAAYRLLTETDYHPIILEASDQIGGISRTAQYKGNRMDLGGHRFFSKNQEVNELWTSLMPLQGAPASDAMWQDREIPCTSGGPDPQSEDAVMLVRNRVSRIYYLQKFFDYPITLKWQTFANMGLGRTIKAGFGYCHSALFKKEEDSLRNFYINRFGKPLYEMFFEDYTEKLWGVNPAYISPDWGAQRVKGLSLRKTVTNALTKPFRKKDGQVETSLIEQFWYPKKGPGQLWEALADKVVSMGAELYKETEVVGISLEEGKVKKVTARRPDGSTVDYCADVFFSTMPVKDLVEGMGDTVPQEIRSIASELPYRDFQTVGLLLNKLKLQNKQKDAKRDLVPDCWIYIQERNVKIGRMQVFNNWSPYLVADPEHTVWVGLEYFCKEGDEMWEQSDEDFIAFAIEEMVKIGVIEKEDVLDSVRLKMKKAYPAYFGAYSEFPRVREFLDAIPNLYLIGRNGQHRYNNMDHSMLTAMEAVRVLANGGQDKSPIWDVNTEQTYHEEKSASAQDGNA